MAVTRPDSPTVRANTDGAASPIALAHTVTTGTTLLIVVTGSRESQQVTGIAYGGAELTLVSSFPSGGGVSADCFISVYGIVNPVVGATNLSISYDNDIDGYDFAVALNYKGTVATSVAAATNELSKDDNNDTVTDTAVHSSGGSAGNALLFAGLALGADMGPASNNAGFSDLVNQESGGGSSASGDAWLYVAKLLDGAPAAITVEWAGTDENVSSYIEIIAGTAGISIEVPAGSLALASAAPVVLIAYVELPFVAPLTLASVAVDPLANHIRGPPVVSATLTGIAPGAVIAHNEQPSAGSLSLTGRQPAVNISSSATVAPGAGALVSQGNAVTLGAVASPGAAELEFTSTAPEREFGLQLSGQIATSILGARAATGVDRVALTGQTPLAVLEILGTTTQVPGAALSTIGHAPLVTVPVSIPINSGALVASTYTPVLEIANAGVAIVNPNAVPVRSNYTHCAYTGFRVPADDLVQTGYGKWVRPKSVEGKHPADFIKAVPQKKKQGPQRPEGPNRFVGEDVPAITADDL